jgi:uncharacterized protein
MGLMSYSQAPEFNRTISVFKCYSKSVERTYDVMVSFPSGYDSGKEQLPALYIFDPDFYYLQFVLSYDSLERNGIAPKAVIVGVGYGTNFLNRSYGVMQDLTPSRLKEDEYDEDIAIIPRDSIARYSGGAEKFISFLKNELFAQLEQRFNISSSRRIAFGNGYGALFLCKVFLKEPTLFEKYNISSPLLWWGDNLLIRTARTSESLAPTYKVFFSYGILESRKTIKSCQQFGTMFEGANFTYRAFNSQDDHTVIPLAFREGFKELFK